ncbi:hypothetical protein BV22DRAFT_1045530 [Leucogyrophana mollusca]|uniref:Uncharacterized protein n=1 Tax=Leucogyrophana mollusca TaxID=85980 RepID=A0ACB8BNS8_9AGAM|nr:hypothetical protein BV22DRAFT_1045530 [Leucogyrophana mollusca]
MESEIAEILYDLKALQRTSFIGVSALVVAVYDHVQTFADEVDLIWGGPVSPITVLYILNRYLGNTLLIVGAISKGYISLPRISNNAAIATPVCVNHVLSDQFVTLIVIIRSSNNMRLYYRCYRLYEFDAWGTMLSAWIVQGVMQLRVFAMYHGSKKIGILLSICFLAEIATSTAILWLNIGPKSPFSVASVIIMNSNRCAVSGIRGNFLVKTYIPVISFDALLFGLAARITARDIVEVIRSGGVGRVHSLRKVLARDSLIYFLSNLTLVIVVTIGWVIYSEGIDVPLLDLAIVITNSRLILGLRARRAREVALVGCAGAGRGIRALDEGIPMHVLDVSVDPLKR